MKGDKEIIILLKENLTSLLTSINQYFLHARICENWGYKKLAGVVYKQSIAEMKFSQKVIDRILLLEGLPNLQKLDPLNIGETVQEQLDSDLKTELRIVGNFREAIAVCIQKSDHVSRELFEEILSKKEDYVDWLETQLQLIKDVGVEQYLSEQMS